MSLARSTLAAFAYAGVVAAAAVPTVTFAQARQYSGDSDEAYGPQKLVDKAASVIEEMSRDPGVRPLMRHAAGLYIIPEYGRAGFIIGGKGGAGVVVTRNGGIWSSPAFFNTGGLNVGLQIGASGGSIVYLLMDRKAVDAFRTRDKLSLDASAGLAVIKYSDAVRASSLRGDAILWTNINGAYAGAVVGATGIGVDETRTRRYYGRPVDVNALLNGRVRVPGADVLDRVLPR